MKHYELRSSRNGTLIFDWDIETGAVTGPGAKQIMELAADGSIAYQPIWHTFSKEPLKNRTDMAAIVGAYHEVPPDLLPFFPVMEDDGIPDKSYVNEDGIEVLGRDVILY